MTEENRGDGPSGGAPLWLSPQKSFEMGECINGECGLHVTRSPQQQTVLHDIVELFQRPGQFSI